jgi:uncharacterized protein YyaL (SSP411 family)
VWLEVVDRKLVKHVLVVAQIVIALSAAPLAAATWGDPALARQSKPLLLVIGYPTAHDWKLVEHPGFLTVAIHRDVYPQVAEAYGRFAAIDGVTGELIFVVTTPHLEPVAASRRKGLNTILDDVAGRWSGDGASLVADAGLTVRRHLLGRHNGAVATALPSLEEALRSRHYDVIGGTFFRTESSFDKSLADHIRYANEALASSENEIARSILDYIIAELQDTTGVFAAGQHADSLVPRDGPVSLEGGQYLWTRAQIERVIGSKAAAVFSYHYGVPAEGEIVPRIGRPLSDTRARFSLGDDELREILRSATQKLFEVRSKRPDPVRDPSFVTELNAQAISVLARAGLQLNEQRYTDAAVRGVRALLQRNRRAGRLFRADAVPALAEDYGALTRALLDVYSATFDPAFIRQALELRTEWMRTAPEGRVPEAVAQLFEARVISRDPRLEAIAGDVAGQSQIVVTGEPWREETRALLSAARATVDDNTLVFLVDNARTRARLAAWMPYVKDIVPIEKRPVAALCQQRTCSTPTSDPAVVAAW